MSGRVFVFRLTFASVENVPESLRFAVIKINRKHRRAPDVRDVRDITDRFHYLPPLPLPPRGSLAQRRNRIDQT